MLPAGMFAFGDMLAFLAVFALAAVPPTVAALFFLRSRPGFWMPLAIAALILAATSVAALLHPPRVDNVSGARCPAAGLAGLRHASASIGAALRLGLPPGRAVRAGSSRAARAAGRRRAGDRRSCCRALRFSAPVSSRRAVVGCHRAGHLALSWPIASSVPSRRCTGPGSAAGVFPAACLAHRGWSRPAHAWRHSPCLARRTRSLRHPGAPIGLVIFDWRQATQGRIFGRWHVPPGSYERRHRSLR